MRSYLLRSKSARGNRVGNVPCLCAAEVRVPIPEREIWEHRLWRMPQPMRKGPREKRWTWRKCAIPAAGVLFCRFDNDIPPLICNWFRIPIQRIQLARKTNYNTCSICSHYLLAWPISKPDYLWKRRPINSLKICEKTADKFQRIPTVDWENMINRERDQWVISTKSKMNC